MKLTINEVQQKAAKVAGIGFLLAIVIVVCSNYAIIFRLVVPGNVAETAQNIKANQTLFLINIVFDLIYAANVIVILAALYLILKSVNRYLALIATFFRMLIPIMWSITALSMFNAVRFLGDNSFLNVFENDQLQTLAKLQLTAGYDAYYISLFFWTLASTVCSYLLFKSGYIPKMLSGFGIVTSVWGVITTTAFIISPGFENIVHPMLYDMPLVIFEITTGIWFLVKGLNLVTIEGDT